MNLYGAYNQREESRFPCQCIGLGDDDGGERLNEVFIAVLHPWLLPRSSFILKSLGDWVPPSFYVANTGCYGGFKALDNNFSSSLKAWVIF